MSAITKKCTIANLEAEPNFVDLVAEYAAECSIDGLPTPSGKLDLYKSIEGAGMMFAYSAHVESVLVGFAVVIVTVNPHYGITLATTETLFVKNEKRNTGAGLKLIKCAECCAVDHGSPGLFIIAPVGGILAEVLERRDYQETNRVFYRNLTCKN